MIQNRHQNVQHIGALQNKVQKLLVVVANLPEEHEQLLVAVQSLGGVRQVALLEWIVQQSRDAFEDEVEVFVAVNSRQIIDEEIVDGLLGGLERSRH
jgi:hypothetical protein